MVNGRTKYFGALVIWIIVAAAAWHTYTRVGHRYGRGEAATQRHNAQSAETFADIKKQQEAFFKEPSGSNFEIEVTTADTKQLPGGRSADREINGTYYAFITNSTVEQVYAMLTNLKGWQVVQPPRDTDRYNVKIKCPLAMKDQLASRFLRHIGWKHVEASLPYESILITEGKPPANPKLGLSPKAKAGPSPKHPLQLNMVVDILEAQHEGPVELAQAVSEKLPMGDVEMDLQLPPRMFVDHVAFQYGVAVHRSLVETTCVLVYHPRHTSRQYLETWTKTGKI